MHICKTKHYSFPLSGFEAIKLEILGRTNKTNAMKKRRTDEIQGQRHGVSMIGEIEPNEIQCDRPNNWLRFTIHNKFVKETAMLLIDLIFSCVLAKNDGKNKMLCSIHHLPVDRLPSMVNRVIHSRMTHDLIYLFHSGKFIKFICEKGTLQIRSIVFYQANLNHLVYAVMYIR